VSKYACISGFLRGRYTHKLDHVSFPHDVDTLNLLQAEKALGIIEHLGHIDRRPGQRVDPGHSLSGIVLLAL
jgi:hypothetical protein